MDAKLVVVGGETQTSEYPLSLPAIVGRSRTADLKLGHPLVSRKHCELFESDGQLMIRDLGSLNGTFVGEARISDTTALPPGATVTIGAVTFQAVYGDMTAEDPADANTSELPDFLAAPAPSSNATASSVEQTLEMDGDSSPVTEPAAAEEGEGGFDFGWLEESGTESEASVEAPAVEESPAIEEPAEAEIVADQTVEPVEQDDALDLPEPTAADVNGVPIEDLNEFAPPEQQPAAGGDDDDDLSDFFASLK